MSPRAPEPPLPGGASSPASLPVSARQGPGGKQWAAGGGGNMEDDVGDEVTSTRGSRAKLSSFSCSHRFPWKSKSVREGLMASRSVPRSPSGSRVSCMVLAEEGSASSLAPWLGGVWAGRGESWGVPGWACRSRCPSGCENNGCWCPEGARLGERCG